MEVIHLKAGEIIAKQKDKVNEWYIIQEGTATLRCDFAEASLGPNSIIGILEQDWFICDYYASSDVTLLIFPCESVTDLKQFLSAQTKMRRVFLRSALVQRHQMLCLYAGLLHKIRQFQTMTDRIYNEYTVLCAKNKIESKTGLDVETMKPLEMAHKAENWEINNSNSLIRGAIEDYLNLMEQDEDLCIGSIMEASAQMHRVARGIGEMTSYLRYNREVMFSDVRNDLFHGILDLQIQMTKQGRDVTAVTQMMEQMFRCAEELQIYDADLLEECRRQYETSAADVGDVQESADETDLEYILHFAGYEEEQYRQTLQMFLDYAKVADADPKDEEAYRLRKKIAGVFYAVYRDCFFQAVEQHKKVTPVMEMFFNFAYLDVAFLGEEQTDALYQLSAHLDMCRSEQVFTIFTWLKAVYEGQKEPSKNEFDMDYVAFLQDAYRKGDITKGEMEARKTDRKAKTEFEMENMFQTVNRVTYGNITMFSPVLCERDLFNSLDKMLVTAQKVEEALNAIRKIDFSLFYRPLYLTGVDEEFKNEMFMREVLPDVILMPNAGTRAMMWQETASVRNDTPARFMVPIFTAVDLNDLLLETCGRYRWELCRKIQGVRWNDIREHSLTSDYYDYLQFYRKNRELSSETKEQIKSSLTRAKNNFREVFVKDYQNWIKYEAKGGFRLNKYVRQIMFTYCPFSKAFRSELKSNPMFADAVARYESLSARTYKRLQGLYDKYKREGGEISPVMKENLRYYEM